MLLILHVSHLSLVMRKPAFCICENKDSDQLRGNREADQHLSFRYTDSTIYFLYMKFQASSHLVWLYSLVCVGPSRKPRRPVFSQRGSFYRFSLDYMWAISVMQKIKYSSKRTILHIYFLYMIMPRNSQM